MHTFKSYCLEAFSCSYDFTMLDKFWSCCWHVEVLAASWSVVFIRRVTLERHVAFSPKHTFKSYRFLAVFSFDDFTTLDKFWTCCWHIEMLVLRPSAMFVSRVTLEAQFFFSPKHTFKSYCLEAFSCSYDFTMLDKFWSCCWHVEVLAASWSVVFIRRVTLERHVAFSPKHTFKSYRFLAASSFDALTTLDKFWSRCWHIEMLVSLSLAHLVALSSKSTFSFLQVFICSSVDELPSPLAFTIPEIFFSCSWSTWISEACSPTMVVHLLTLACNSFFSFVSFSVFDCSFSVFCSMFPVRFNSSNSSVMFFLYSSCWIFNTLFSSFVSFSSLKKVFFSFWNSFLSVVNWKLISLIFSFNNSSSFCILDFSIEKMFMVSFSCCNSCFSLIVLFFWFCKSLVKFSVSMEQSDVPDLNRSVLVCV